MKLIPEAELVARSFSFGLRRAEAVVLAHLAFHEQLKGGVQLAGTSWRYRTVAEIGAKVGYEDRTVTRAIAALVDADFIERRTIWDPRWAGRRVNSYRLTKSGARLLAPVSRPGRDGPGRARQPDPTEALGPALSPLPNMPNRSSQDGGFIYRGQDNERDRELLTLATGQEERVSLYLQGNLPASHEIERSFGRYLEQAEAARSPGSAQQFWLGLEEIMSEREAQIIEPGDQTVFQRCGRYLALFGKPNQAWLHPLEHCAIAVWAYLNWSSVAWMIESHFGKRPQSISMNSYHLEKHSFLIVNRLSEQKRYAEDAQGNVGEWLSGSFD